MSPPAFSASSSSSSSKNLWPSKLALASPNPTQLEGGRQLEGAPMCPCNDCWEYGSHRLAPPRAPKAPKAPKPSAASSSKDKKSPLHFIKKTNTSKESVASDMHPLKQSVTLASAASSVYGDKY
ncbi:hypothetical protein SPBR_02124 [Sporothrix brasiliensis 5110]|uniref:Uncharacterized protein n=1 Tax=Sporothrix brasiliensis 5110 TaxID=1398154 RepID=A0A0C2FK66_9PEZI|nr:uncharacterized protein SPBR_02124 [Sporothrix brasiliensis 5110]KIH91438.1 hypothetical protein SPBR_02124 [Sporothrix brasiliensis 5110]